MKFSFLNYEPLPTPQELNSRMELLVSLGYQGIELSAKYPHDFSLENVQALVKRHNLPVVSLLSGWSYGHEGLSLCSPRQDIRERAVGRLCGYVNDAAQLNAVLVVGLMQGLRSDEPEEKLAVERITYSLRQIAAHAESRGATVVIEPVNHLQVGFHHTAGEVANLVRQVGSPALSYMLDTIHMNIEERSVLECVKVHGSAIRHFHLCEANGGPFGSGNLDFSAVLKQLAGTGYEQYVSVKIYRRLAPPEAAHQAAHFLRGLGWMEG